MAKVTFELEVGAEGPDLLATVAGVWRVIEGVEGVTVVSNSLVNPTKPSFGHVPGCRQVNERGVVVRGEVCTCGPVPR